MSANELRKAAERIRGGGVADIVPGLCDALAVALVRATFLAEESEHAAAVVSDACMTNVEPKLSPLVRDLIGLARIINGGAA